MAWAAIDPDEKGPYLAVGCALSENHLCEQVPGMNYSKADRIWRAPLRWPAWVALTVLWSGQPLNVHPQLQDWAMRQWQAVERAYELRGSIDCPHPAGASLLDELDEKSGRSLFTPQRGGAWWLPARERAILGDPQGNGKTPQVIRGIQLARAISDDDKPWLVIAPVSSLFNWQREFGRWAPEMKVRVLDGSADKRRRAIMDEGEPDVFVIGWPNVRMHTRLMAYPGQALVRCDEHGGITGKTAAMCEVHEKELNAVTLAGVVADEAHRMKDARSKQTRAVWQLASAARYFWAATGTLTADSIADLWPVLHCIDPKAYPSRSRYLDLFAEKRLDWHGGTEILGIRPDTENAFHAIVQPLIRRIPKEVSRPFQPPRMEPVFRYPKMTPAQERAYKQLKKEALAYLDGATVTPKNAVVVFSRLCQLAAASAEAKDGEDADGFTKQLFRMSAPSSKVDDLADFLEDNPGQLVVCMNTPQLADLCAAKLAGLKITHCMITGRQSAAERDQAVEMFQDGKCRVIMITAGAGGESITLTASDTVLFLQPNPSMLVTEQVIGRVDRIGQKNAVRVVYSISQGTVEERLYQLSQEKAERANDVTRDADLMRWLLGTEEAKAGKTQ